MINATKTAADTTTTAEALAKSTAIQHIIFACDAGMGSSAMGASILRDKVDKAGLQIPVTNTSISNLQDETGLLVVTQNELATRALEKTPRAMHVAVDNFLNSPKYDQIVQILQKKQAATATPEPTNSPAATAATAGSMGIAGLELSKINTVEFVYQEHNLGSATMAQSIFKNELHKTGVTQVAVGKVAVNEIQDVDSILVIANRETAQQLSANLTNAQLLIVADLVQAPEYPELAAQFKS